MITKMPSDMDEAPWWMGLDGIMIMIMMMKMIMIMIMIMITAMVMYSLDEFCFSFWQRMIGFNLKYGVDKDSWAEKFACYVKLCLYR